MATCAQTGRNPPPPNWLTRYLAIYNNILLVLRKQWAIVERWPVELFSESLYMCPLLLSPLEQSISLITPAVDSEFFFCVYSTLIQQYNPAEECLPYKEMHDVWLTTKPYLVSINVLLFFTTICSGRCLLVLCCVWYASTPISSYGNVPGTLEFE